MSLILDLYIHRSQGDKLHLKESGNWRERLQEVRNVPHEEQQLFNQQKLLRPRASFYNRLDQPSCGKKVNKALHNL